MTEIWHSVSCVFVLQRSALREDIARRLFREALPGRPPPQFDSKGRQSIEDENVRNWLASGTTMVLYRGDPAFPKSPLAYVHAVPHDDGGELDLGLTLSVDQCARGLALTADDFGPKSGPETRRFVFERFVAAFDVLQPEWGYADQSMRMGFGGETPPPRHWLEFYSPSQEEEARRAEKEGAAIERRDWGGFVVRRWEDPFKPPKGAAGGR